MKQDLWKENQKSIKDADAIWNGNKKKDPEAKKAFSNVEMFTKRIRKLFIFIGILLERINTLVKVRNQLQEGNKLLIDILGLLQKELQDEKKQREELEWQLESLSKSKPRKRRKR